GAKEQIDQWLKRAEELSKEERPDEAITILERARELAEKRLGDREPATTALVLNDLALSYAEAGQHEKAEPLLLRSLAIRETKLGKDHPDTAESLHNLAAFYRDMGRYRESEPLFRRALAINEAKLGKDHVETINCIGNMGKLYVAMARYADAESLLR